MPVLKFKHVVSFSSEDTKHPASNLLKPETYYKWKCSSGNDRQASVLLQLEKSTQINAVDIGNNGSAFVEVLVGRSSWSSGEEFKVLLVASSFMSPVESKSGKDLYRVRMFGLDSLNKAAAEEKWDQVKVVCTQPYNQSEGYGLSFLKLCCPKEEEKVEEKTIKLGRFILQSNSDDEDDDSLVSAGSFFQKRLNILPTPKASPKPSVAATVREASNTPVTKSTAYKTKAEVSSNQMSVSVDKRKQVASALMKGSNQPTFSDLISKESTNKVQQKLSMPAEPSKRKMDTTSQSDTPSKKIKATSTNTANKQATATNTGNRESKNKKTKTKKKNVPFSIILEGVTFTLSGYKNPERGDIRDMGLSMGARYEPNWNHKCSHLICAFANTPKFQQVKDKGKIVTKTWFEDCKKCKRRKNTKEHRLDDGGESSYESSSDEDTRGGATSGGGATSSVATNLQRNRVDDMTSDNKIKHQSSECDTEDELEKLRNFTKQQNNDETNDQLKNTSKITNDNIDEYGGTTEEEDNGDDTNTKIRHSIETNLPDLPNFFDKKTFFFYGDLDKRDKRLLTRYITAYAGTIENYMTDKVDYVISSEDWDENFDQALSDKASLVFIRPKWVLKCHEAQKMLPFERYMIAP